jgi:hypothetical protein
VWYCLFVIVFPLFHIDYDCQLYILWKFMCPENTIDLLQIPNVSYQEHCSTCGNRTIIWLVIQKNVYTVYINRCNPSLGDMLSDAIGCVGFSWVRLLHYKLILVLGLIIIVPLLSMFTF